MTTTTAPAAARDYAAEFIAARRAVNAPDLTFDERCDAINAGMDIADAARQAGVILDETTLAAQASRGLSRNPYAHLSDRALVQRYDAEARERWTDQDDALLSSGRMDDMHAELVARDLDWDDPRYSA